MTEQPHFVIASSDIAVISLPGNVMKGLAQQLQEFSDQHPETLGWQPVSVASESEPEG